MTKSSSDGTLKKIRRAARRVGNFVGDAYHVTRKVGDKAVDAYHATRKVGNYVGDKAVDAYHATRKVGKYVGDKAVDAYNAYKYAKHTAKLGAIQLKQFNADNNLIHACVTGTASEISDAIKISNGIRQNKMSVLNDDPNPDLRQEQRDAQAKVFETTYNAEVDRLNHLKTCMMEYADKSERKSPSRSSPSSYKSPTKPSPSPVLD